MKKVLSAKGNGKKMKEATIRARSCVPEMRTVNESQDIGRPILQR